MRAGRILLGVAAGIGAGYAAARAFEAATELRSPCAPHVRDAAAYGRVRRALDVAGAVRSLTNAAVWAFLPEAVRLDATRAPVWLRPAIFALAAQSIDALGDLPAAFVEDHALERRFGLSEQSRTLWLNEYVKGSAVSMAVTAVLATLFGAVLRSSRRRWPLLASAGTLPLLVLANVVGPLWILPLFNRFEALRGPLEARIRRLAAHFGCGDAEILRVDMSRQTKKANAYVTGVGPVKRIVVGDTLLRGFPDDELLFVVAHELGHYVSRDPWRVIAIAELAAAALYSLAGELTRVDVDERADRPQTLARVVFWTMCASQIARPALTAFARSREWAADRFALRATGDPAGGACAFARLREQNLVEDEQPAWYEALFSTHPSLKARIAYIKSEEGRVPSQAGRSVFRVT